VQQAGNHDLFLEDSAEVHQPLIPSLAALDLGASRNGKRRRGAAHEIYPAVDAVAIRLDLDGRIVQSSPEGAFQALDAVRSLWAEHLLRFP
jgi:hypothetical protein